jgi:segregation and condensation protein A
MENPTFFLEGIVRDRNEVTDFEGPLSLILMLLSKNKIAIRDIKISEILDQFLSYMDQMQEMNLEIACEFVQMASYLLYVKTKTILAGEEEVTELEQLMTSLEQLRCRNVRESIRSITPEFSCATENGLRMYTRTQEQSAPKTRVYDYRHDATDLFRALYSIFSRTDARVPAPPELNYLAPKRIIYGVREKCREIIGLLRDGKSTTLRTLFESGKSHSEIIATFISVLELCAAGSLLLVENGLNITVTFTGGDADDIIESIEE